MNRHCLETLERHQLEGLEKDQLIALVLTLQNSEIGRRIILNQQLYDQYLAIYAVRRSHTQTCQTLGISSSSGFRLRRKFEPRVES